MRLEDKVALITGASSGIGKAIATRFAAEGAHIVVNYRPGSEIDTEAAQAEAASFGPSSIVVVADVSKREDVERMMQEIVKTIRTH
jgi:NAD(P)-dependent dehydrogenase (short-subunit alcohol dehydrogenase family)